MISGFNTGVFADDFAAELVASVKERVGIPEEFSKLETSKYQSEDGEIYSLNWENENDESIFVRVTSSGIITYYSNSGVEAKSGLSGITASEAAFSANEFMKRINPGIASQYVFDEENVSLGGEIMLRAERIVGGARVEDNRARVRMDGETGEIAYFSLSFTEYEFDKTDGVIGIDAAAEQFQKQTSLILAYLKTEKGIIPVYVNFEGKYADEFGIDAKNGEYVSCAAKYYFSGGAMAEDAVSDSNRSDKQLNLTDSELEEISKYDGFITKEKAEKILKDIKELGLDGFSVNSASYRKHSKYEKDEASEDDVVWLSLSLNKESEGAYAVLNAKTGEVIEFYRYGKTEKSAKNIDAEQIAASVMKKLYGGKNYILAAKNGGGFYYLETLGGVPYLGSAANVTVSDDGVIESFYASWAEKEPSLEPIGEIIDNKAALKAYKEASEYELMHKNLCGTDAAKIYGASKEEDKPLYKLIYMRTSAPDCINAKTGKPTDERGEEYTEEITAFSDIKGHWCAAAVEALVKNGYLVIDDESFFPNREITAKEAQSMLFGAGIYGYDFESEKEALTREEAAKAIVCGLGYEKIGKVYDMFVPVFYDWNGIDEDFRGYVALAKGMGIVSGDQNGFFNPKNRVSRAEFAVMLYNCIKSDCSAY